MTPRLGSVTMSDMKVTSRDFQRDFARMKAKAKTGEAIYVTSGAEEFLFQAVKPRTWQGALKGKAFNPASGWDSDPATEHQETVNKSAAPLRAIAIANALRR